MSYKAFALLFACSLAGTAIAQRDCSGVISMFDTWCDNNCNHNPPFCPASLCSCASEDPAPTPFVELLDIQKNNPRCCEQDSRYVFFSENGAIYRKQVGTDDSQLCYSFPIGSPSSMVVDSDNNLWVAVPEAGAVYRASANCNDDDDDITVVTSWIRDGQIGNPQALAIVPGEGLLISGYTGVWFARFTEDGDVFDIERVTGTPDLQYFVRDMAVYDGTAYFISRDAKIHMLDVDDSLSNGGEFLAIHQYGIPDYGGITVNDCGLFFSATDLNQVWFCPDYDVSRCQRYCTRNESMGSVSCDHTINPTGMASGCCCDIYVANTGNGCVTRIPNIGDFDDDNDDELNTGPIMPEVVECGLDYPLAVAFWVLSDDSGDCDTLCEAPEPSPSNTPSNSAAPSPTASPSGAPSDSPSSAPSPTSSPSGAPSPTASPSGAPSSSPSASTSPSASPSPSTTAQVQARLIPGFNIQASGAADISAVITGTVRITMVLCPPGVNLDDHDEADYPAVCPALADRTFRIPMSQLFVLEGSGATRQINNILPYISAAHQDSSVSVCLLYAQALINRNGVVDICDETCLQNNEGQVVDSINCLSDPNTVSLNFTETSERCRAAATDLLGNGVNENDLPNDAIQPANEQLCPGDVVVEAAVNVMNVPFGDTVSINFVIHPRIDEQDRCDSADDTAPRLCFDTAADPNAIHPVVGFGPTNSWVCVEEFLVRDGDTGGFFTFDPNLPIRNGDIMDPQFSATTRSAGCIDTMDTVEHGPLCGSTADAGTFPSPDSRICLRTPCT